MEIPRPSPRSQGSLPPIYVDDVGPPPRPYGSARRSPFASSPFSPAFASIPMPIPNASDDFRAPPPLPPPRVVPVPGPMSAAAEEYRRREQQRESVDDLPNYKMRLDRDEGYYSMESRSRDSFPAAAAAAAAAAAPVQQLGLQQGPYQFRPSSDAYDNSLLSKLDIRGTLDNRSPPRHGCSNSGGSGSGSGSSGLSASAHDLRPVDRFASLQPLSLPTRMKQQGGPPLLDSPNRYNDTPLHSAVSPRSAPFSSSGSTSLGLGGNGNGSGNGSGSGSGSGGYRSPKETAATSPSDYSYYDRSPSVRTRRTNSGSLPDDDEAGFPMDETSRLRDLRLEAAAAAAAAAGPAPRPAHHASSSLSLALSAGDYHATGQKRRASSPPGGDELPPLPLYGMPSSEHLRRRDGAARGAAAPRLRAVSPQDALSPSSASSAAAVAAAAAAGPGRPGSYGSAHSPAATSATSAGSTCGTTASTCTSPYMACAPSVPLTLLPRVAAGPQRTPHRAGDAAGKPAGLLTRSDFFMCDCCPKKPKKFESEEQLRAHEMEKQYECHYCGNRFKNKNEAERHQNSLHVRRHSWSCAALSGYDRAFHESTLRPGEVDMCGYCGEEFPRSGHGAAGADTPAWHATDQDWDERIRHLQDVHKFRECNASKKFFRADHFRQHLKHSHAGTSGKWTNMLENACMIEEEPPLPMR